MELTAAVGGELGVSRWIEISQQRIEQFAECTEDRQWIHLDHERAARGPFGTTIAHGYLTLSLVSATLGEVLGDGLGSGMVINYGLDRLRFVTPLKSGSRIRNRVTLQSIDSKGPGRTLYTFGCTMEIEGADAPALVASVLCLATG